MTPLDIAPFDPALDLRLERTVPVPVELVWKAWTTPEHLMQWFTPAPWKTIACEIDLRPGGRFRTVMLSPEGAEHPNIGCYLEVVPNRLLIWSDALGPGYRPSVNSFFTAILSLEPHEGGTRYTAIARHKDPDTRKQHEEMGFLNGWSTVLDQLVAYIQSGVIA